MRQDSNRTRASARQRWDEAQLAFNAVTRKYAELSELPAIAVFNLDDEAPRSHTLSVGGRALDYKIDVEKHTADVLRDDLRGQRAWFSLLADERVDAKLARSVIDRCGNRYIRAGLLPWKYLSPTVRLGKRSA